MTSDRRRRANRLNAASSTGPRTSAGKAKVAQNGRKHGLNSPIQADAAWRARPMEIAQALADGGAITPALFDYATAYAELDRIRVTKQTERRKLPPLDATAVTGQDAADVVSAILRQLKRLDGYERKILSRLRTAAHAVETERLAAREPGARPPGAIGGPKPAGG